MLSAPDRALAERDPALPGLAILLDPEATAALVRRLYPEASVRSATATYLRYKPAASCLVAYRVSVDGGETLAYARASRLDAPHKILKPRDRPRREAVSPSLGGAIRVAAGEGVTIYPFPNDHELRRLARIADVDLRRELLEAVLPDHPELWGGTLAPLRYKPERRLVASLARGEIAGGTPAAVLKFVRRSEIERSSAALERLRCAAPLRLPRLLGSAKKDAVFGIEWLEGRPLDELLVAEPFPAEAFRLGGAALARLHEQDAKLEGRIDAAVVASTLRATASDLGYLDPRVAGRADDLARRLEELLRQVPMRPATATLHGDFSPDQVLARSGESAVVDLDNAAQGDPSIDLAWFQASLLAAAAVEGLARDRARCAFEALIAGYRSVRPVETGRHLGALTAAALLRRAVEPFRLRAPAWPAANEALLAEGEAVLDGIAVASEAMR